MTYDGVVAGEGTWRAPICPGTKSLRAVVGISSDVKSKAFYDDVLLDVE